MSIVDRHTRQLCRLHTRTGRILAGRGRKLVATGAPLGPCPRNAYQIFNQQFSQLPISQSNKSLLFQWLVISHFNHLFQGYIKRQALYACLTCTPPDSGRKAGVCLACSYHCHEDHELVELYTKRNFRCDCGTQVFNGKKCSLLADKPLEPNEKNSYNQNFIGLYCSCNRPYPDPEDDTEDVMIQCIICEDWYHFRVGKSYELCFFPPSTFSVPDLLYFIIHKLLKPINILSLV